ncbi:MAG: helix-turn-helix domain-containing protein [Pseudonocardiales bacterium]|nr:helix-turn-helix domain-containing protein [Pseudonocardiales bacterium]
MTKNASLTVEERELISRELAKKSSHRSIAKVLGRHHSVISREIHRNGGDDHYRAVVAEERAATMRRVPNCGSWKPINGCTTLFSTAWRTKASP